MRNCSFLLLALCAGLFGQSTSGTITGSVTDPTGAAIPDASVEARDTASNRMVRTTTSTSGAYTLPGLPIGLYEIKVSLTGFKTTELAGVEVRVAQTTTQNVTLQVGEVTESISVSGEAPLISPNSAAVTTTVQNKLLMDLLFLDGAAALF